MVRGSAEHIGGIPFGGILPGIVVANTPIGAEASRGSVRVWIPTLHGAEQPEAQFLPEALVCFPWGGQLNTGIVIIPPIGSSVLCGFIEGYVEKPVVLGYFYGANEIPTEFDATKPESALILQHPSGWTVKLDFTSSVFEITNPEQNKIMLDSNGVSVSKAGEQATARLIHEFGIDTFTGAPLGEATQGATAAIKVSQSPT